MGGISWSVNEIAFIKYCRYKGLKHLEIASILPDRKIQAIRNMSSLIGQFEKNKIDPNNPSKEKIIKGLQLEFAVQSNRQPELKQTWDDRIARVTHIKTKQSSDVAPEKAETQPLFYTALDNAFPEISVLADKYGFELPKDLEERRTLYMKLEAVYSAGRNHA